MALGYPLEEADEDLLKLDVGSYERLLGHVLEGDSRKVALVASTLRRARTATLNDWSAVCRTRDGFRVGPSFEALEILDRVGGGDSFASGLDLRLARTARHRDGARLRRGAWGVCDDDARRHIDGNLEPTSSGSSEVGPPVSTVSRRQRRPTRMDI